MQWKVCKCLFLASLVLIDISFGHISCKKVSFVTTFHHIATHAELRLCVRENRVVSACCKVSNNPGKSDVVVTGVVFSFYHKILPVHFLGKNIENDYYYYYYYNIPDNVSTRNFRMRESVIESLSE